MSRVRPSNYLLVLLVLVVTVVYPAGAISSEHLETSWSFTAEGSISAITTNEYGTEWYIGTDTGLIYKFDDNGKALWDNPIRHQFNRITDIVVSDESNSFAVVYKTGSTSNAAYFIDSNTLEVWQEFTGDIQYDITVTNRRGLWFTLFSSSSAAETSYICYMDRTRGDVFETAGINAVPAKLLTARHAYITAQDMLVGPSINNPKNLLGVSLSDFPAVSSMPLLSALSAAGDRDTINARILFTTTADITGIAPADSHVGIQTTDSTYILKILLNGDLQESMHVPGLSDNPISFDISNDGVVITDGRGPTIDIYRYDGLRTGTYDTGGLVLDTYLSRANGLYALATSSDSKFYVFSKDESSMWYLLFSSLTGDGITASYLTDYADYISVARGNSLAVYTLRPAAVEEKGSVTLRIYERSNPYADAGITIQRSTDNVWTDTEHYTTDAGGTVVIQAVYGERINVIVGDNLYSQTIIPTLSQPEYIIQIPIEEPLRSGANYKSWYDSATGRIYYTFEDKRGKTSKVIFSIIRSSDGATVHTMEYILTPDDTSTYTGFYDIPVTERDTSYRVQMTVSGSPSFTNTWHQWIKDSSGVASLPVELTDGMKTGIFMLVILFAAGIFSYFSGPHGAVVVSLMAGVFVFWGWLPLSPATVGLCIVWSFLGLLGRSSVG